MGTIRVVAFKKRQDSPYAGYDGWKRRKHLEEFDWPEGQPIPSWCVRKGEPIPGAEVDAPAGVRLMDQAMTLKEAARVPELPTGSQTPPAVKKQQRKSH